MTQLVLMAHAMSSGSVEPLSGAGGTPTAKVFSPSASNAAATDGLTFSSNSSRSVALNPFEGVGFSYRRVGSAPTTVSYAAAGIDANPRRVKQSSNSSA